jgi:hypothetical protein
MKYDLDKRSAVIRRALLGMSGRVKTPCEAEPTSCSTRNRNIFARTPYLDERPCFCATSRDVLERDLLYCCIVNPEAMRLVTALGFNTKFLRRGINRALLGLAEPSQSAAQSLRSVELPQATD